MKVCLYFEGSEFIKTSGIGRALKHQIAACESAQIEITLNPDDDYDILHINTVGITSSRVIKKARKKGCKIIYHAHSTEEDFRNSFIFSNVLSKYFKKNLIKCYSKADLIITPTPYSKKILEKYHLNLPIVACSNGIELNRFKKNDKKINSFKEYFSILDNEKVVISVGLYFERKGIIDFVEVAKKIPHVKFIWFGHTPLYSIPKSIRKIIKKHPDNVYFPGYIKGDILEGAYNGADCFFFPSNEETEGIVVLEALASYQNVLLRDIPVYDPWLKSGVDCFKGKDNFEFEKILLSILNGKEKDLRMNGYNVAKSKSIHNIGIQLKEIYELVVIS